MEKDTYTQSACRGYRCVPIFLAEDMPERLPKLLRILENPQLASKVSDLTLSLIRDGTNPSLCPPELLDTNVRLDLEASDSLP